MGATQPLKSGPLEICTGFWKLLLMIFYTSKKMFYDRHGLVK
jgi:hypothetical protein